MSSLFTKSRVVAFLTPVFAAGSALGTPFLVKLGFHVDPTQVTALAIAGATAATTAALKWLHGNSEWEREYQSLEGYFKTHVEPEADKVEAAADAADPGIVQDIEGQADKVVEAARAKLVAIISPTPAGAAVTPVAPIPTPATPEPEAAA
jgi:hypothetical protein